MKRENTEWVDIWLNGAGTESYTRYMLIGDSISKGYRGPVHESVWGRNKDAVVDTYSTSRSVDDPAYFAELELLLGKTTGGYQYKVIHFNNGLHGFHLSAQEYGQGVRKALDLIKKLQPQAKIVIATSTPTTIEGKPGIPDDDNKYPVERNIVLQEIASEYGYELNDLYSFVMNNGDFEQPDGVHFNPDGSKRLAEKILNYIV